MSHYHHIIGKKIRAQPHNRGYALKPHMVRFKRAPHMALQRAKDRERLHNTRRTNPHIVRDEPSRINTLEDLNANIPDYTLGDFLVQHAKTAASGCLDGVLQRSYIEPKEIAERATQLPQSFKETMIYAGYNNITDFHGLEYLVNARFIGLNDNKIRDISGLPEYLRTRCLLLLDNRPVIDLTRNPIDWRNGSNKRAVDQVSNMGIKLFLDENYEKIPVRTEHRSPYDALLLAGIPPEAIENNPELWEYIDGAKRDETPSKNEAFHVRHRNGKNMILKIFADPECAKTEAKLNYWLGREFLFIPKGMYPEVINAGNLYMTLQDKVRGTPRDPIHIDYWLMVLSRFHNDARNVLEENNVVIPGRAPISSADEYLERWKGLEDFRGTRIDKKLIEDSANYVRDSTNTCLIHGDVKLDNLHGEYLIDLEKATIGDPAIDLAGLFMHYGLPEEVWPFHIDSYLEYRGYPCYQLGKREEEFKKLYDGVQLAKHVIAFREIIGSESRSDSKRTKKQNEMLMQYLK